MLSRVEFYPEPAQDELDPLRDSVRYETHLTFPATVKIKIDTTARAILYA